MDLLKGLQGRLSGDSISEIEDISYSLMNGIFRCTSLGVVITILMKLQSSFLQSSSSNIVEWLVADFRSPFVSGGAGGLEAISVGIAPGFYYSFFCLVTIVGAFVFASRHIRWSLAQLHESKSGSRLLSPWFVMNGTMALLVVSYFLIGAVPGFTIFLLFSLVLAGYLLSKPASPRNQGSL